MIQYFLQSKLNLHAMPFKFNNTVPSTKKDHNNSTCHQTDEECNNEQNKPVNKNNENNSKDTVKDNKK